MKECIKNHHVFEIIQGLPSLPGVYRFLNNERQVLYVGKARDLRKRILSYFNKNIDSPRIALMVEKIDDVEITITRSENEALLLESNLIKTLAPRYNILFRDDKTYPYLKLSSHSFPRMVYYRGSLDKENLYYGPFPSAWAVRESIHILQVVFKLRVCEDSVFNHRTRPCLLHSINRCSAPCTGKISQMDYAANVKLAINFLSGGHTKLIKNLETKMQNYSIDLDFEKAAVIRNQILALNSVLQKQSVDVLDSSDVDIIAVVSRDKKICVNLAMVRGGRHLGDKAYFPDHLSQAIVFDDLDHAACLEKNEKLVSLPFLNENDVCAEILKIFIMQHYIDTYLPNTLIISHPLSVSNFDLFLSKQHGKKIKIISHPHGQRKVWLTMAKDNAELSFTKFMVKQVNRYERAMDLIRVLKLNIDRPENLYIECFDVSHTNGEATQAACVTYRGCMMKPNEYRRYNITGITPGDDYASMRQAMERHYKRKIKNIRFLTSVRNDAQICEEDFMQKKYTDENDKMGCFMNSSCEMPNLVLVDGGRGQLELARKIFVSLGLNSDCIVGVAKGEGRKVGNETLIFGDERPPLNLGNDSMALMLIAQIRDEAHRFAITGMRSIRQKSRKCSRLEEISGIGQKRRQRLLIRFGGLRGVQGAGIEELASVEGISKTLAEHIYSQLH